MDYVGDGTFREIDGVEAQIEDVRRAVTTPAGALWWAPTATLDVGDLVNATIDASDERRLESQIAACFQGDQTKTVEQAVRRGVIGIRAFTEEGDFQSTFSLQDGELKMEVTKL